MNDSPLVNRERLVDWLDEHGIGSGPISDWTVLTGGTQNILIKFTRSGADYVFRRPPEHKRKNSDATMDREATVLAALAGSDVPHPRLVASCSDLDVLGCSFFVMEAVSGFTATSEVPEPHASSPELQHALGLSMTDALAALGRIDPEVAGVSHLGKADGWLDRQVTRWQSQLDSYAEFDGWPGPDNLGDVNRLGSWLDEHRPTAWTPGLIHGDFHFGNVMFNLDGPQVASVVDWELSTIGDPLLDLGHLLATWPDPAETRRTGLVIVLDGLPSRDEIIARYTAGSDRDLTAVDWYQVLACYRLAILLEGTYARACAGRAPRDIGDRLHLTAQALVDQGLRILESSRASAQH